MGWIHGVKKFGIKNVSMMPRMGGGGCREKIPGESRKEAPGER